MNREEFEQLNKPEARLVISKNIDADPLKFALNYKSESTPAHLISTQIKYLQRAKNKLPSYYKAQCIIPPLSYEQSSSEATAGLKNQKGTLCLDLTCGLGVDSFYFSKSFNQVISLEMNPVLADITRSNFGLLGASNIEVINQRAEDFIAHYTGEKFDLVFVDPARRDDSQGRVFLFEDCSPNLYEILPQVAQISKKLIVKASPLFDNAEAWKRFPELASLTVVSVDNECKELLLEFNFEQTPNEQTEAILLNRRGITSSYTFIKKTDLIDHPTLQHQPINYLLEPDVAFYKSRLNIELFNKYFSDLKLYYDQPDGYFFSDEIVKQEFPGRVFRIIEELDYQPKSLKKHLKEKGIKKANVSKRNFPIGVDEIRKSLNLADGGSVYLFFTKHRSGIAKVLITERC
ncbi:hypothetical protein C3K47_07440 [Solitalea longa]|uniref:THUMP-like domain-containing protein n=1 Tax=Solitalea longa TaxID=2079460 RepID=A0A2S5A4X6_9SPHI|nr:RsmD family RNA methyltransferase [Solitalea longa]POY37584.1 hypothetical protein C3K47_07440 [Solitalea longa]